MVGVSLHNLHTLKGGIERVITGLMSDTKVSLAPISRQECALQSVDLTLVHPSRCCLLSRSFLTKLFADRYWRNSSRHCSALSKVSILLIIILENLSNLFDLLAALFLTKFRARVRIHNVFLSFLSPFCFRNLFFALECTIRPWTLSWLKLSYLASFLASFAGHYVS